MTEQRPKSFAARAKDARWGKDLRPYFAYRDHPEHRRIILDKRLHFSRSGRQAVQVERCPTDQRRPVRPRGRPDPLSAQARRHERIDRVIGVGCRHVRLGYRLEGPMRALVFREAWLARNTRCRTRDSGDTGQYGNAAEDGSDLARHDEVQRSGWRSSPTHPHYPVFAYILSSPVTCKTGNCGVGAHDFRR